MAATKPPLHIPASNVTVKVSAIDSTLLLNGALCSFMWDPEIKGFDRLKIGAWCFLIEHPVGRKLVYDLGCRKDWQNLSPAIGLDKFIASGIVNSLDVEKNVAETLTEGGMNLAEIEGVIWSHWHFDHTGDPSTLPTSTKLIVGEGFQAAFLPGYPTNPKAHVLEADFRERELMEVPFSSSSLNIGRFRAYDYFGDGSFYILDSPGHAIGHVNALARTSASEFVHLGGDSIHHAAEIRPSTFLPLPDSISPSPVPSVHPGACPGHFFSPVLRNGSKIDHILGFKDPFPHEDQRLAMIYDESALRETVGKDTELDAHDNVFTIAAHDWSLKGVIDEWPKSLNSWKEAGWKDSTRWKFLEDFEKACT